MVYATTMATNRAISFLLLPIFTRVLQPSQYGKLSIALSANAVATVVFAFGLELAIFRGAVHLSDDPDARDRFVRSIWTFLLIAPLAAGVVVTSVMAPLLWGSPVLSAGTERFSDHFAACAAPCRSAAARLCDAERSQHRDDGGAGATLGGSVSSRCCRVACGPLCRIGGNTSDRDDGSSLSAAATI
jgi:hypothetical protein